MVEVWRKIQIGLLLGVLFLFTGCDAPEVVIVIAPGYDDAVIQVDFVKVPRTQKALWMAIDLDEYFAPGDPLRQRALEQNAIHSVHYNIPGKKFQSTFSRNDPVWRRFGFDTNSTEQDFDIFVLADLPGSFDSSAADPRRRVIPLYRKAWPASFLSRLFGGGRLDRLTVTVSQVGIFLDPAPVE